MLFNINVLDTNLDYVACLKHLGGMLNKLIAHLGDVKKTGDVIEVRIKDVDVKKHRISLTRKGMNTAKS